ncbi:hypothetical protein MMC09_006680 [Bachmanniomyces sp. S44760]|nr:hypothetical protein [Bachmanniomyces sp. S44760]
MQSLSPSTGLTITNPLVLYRALLATKQIDPDPAQHRLALHLQKLYHRLKDYEPEIEYSRRLEEISRALGRPATRKLEESDRQNDGSNSVKGKRGVFSSLRTQQEKAEAMALTRKMTSQESAVHMQSPRGLLLYGEVGTGKSMLVDLLADSLPNRKKRRWHFNTFMLETFARLEQLRRSRLTDSRAPVGLGGREEEHSLLWLARDMISTSPILFLDEFQLPDRAASKILSNLLTSFFHLGGVLVATSNRMPEELANASGVEFAQPPSSRLGLFGTRWGLLGAKEQTGRSENMFAGKGDFAAFLEVLKARCEIWDMEGKKDWRRKEAEGEGAGVRPSDPEDANFHGQGGFEGLEAMAPGNWGLGYEQSLDTKSKAKSDFDDTASAATILPKHYFVTPSPLSSDVSVEEADQKWQDTLRRLKLTEQNEAQQCPDPKWKTGSLRVYGRNVFVPRCLEGIAMWTFSDLCESNLGPADYISLASAYHTIILTEVPILNLLQKNEARRLITLLDALYEARCKLLIQAEAGPDDIFFPETSKQSSGSDQDSSNPDGTYAETFSEIFQDQTSPFRPNISSYTPSSSPPSYASSPLPSTPHSPNTSTSSVRSILADEDSDFGPVYGAGRSSSPHHTKSGSGELTSEYRDTRGPSDGAPGAGNEIGQAPTPNFQQTGTFTGEDERFAYKRARSRLWEMCGSKWWARREEGWWRPVGREVRRWEGELEVASSRERLEEGDPIIPETEMQKGDVGKDIAEKSQNDSNKEEIFKHGATSPFRTSQEPPPKIPWTHAWGMMTWGKKAGAWGKGVEGLSERKETKSEVGGGSVEQIVKKNKKLK